MRHLKKIITASLIFMAPSVTFAGNWPNDVMDAIDVKQAAFCNLVASYKDKAKEAMLSENIIKQMLDSKEQSDDLKALIRDRMLEYWVTKDQKVDVMKSAWNETIIDEYYVKLNK